MFYFRLKDCVDFETLERYGFVYDKGYFCIKIFAYHFGISEKSRKLIFEQTPMKMMFLDVFYKLVNDGLIELIEIKKEK